MDLNDDQLLEFRDRCLQAVYNGYSIGRADEYVTVLAQEVGQEIVPEGVAKGSALHLLDLANEALDQRKGGKRVARATREAKNEESKPSKVKVSEEVPSQPKADEQPEAKVEPTVEEKTEEKPEAKVEEKPEAKVEEKVEPVKEAPKAEEKKSSKKK